MRNAQRHTGSHPPPAAGATALRFVVAYVLVGGAWILVSDRLLAWLVPDPVARADLEMLKGGLFVLLTAALLFFLLRRSRSQLAERDREIRAVLDSMTDAVLVTSAGGELVDVNLAATRLLGPRLTLRLPLPYATVARCLDLRTPDGRRLQAEESATWRALAGETVTAYDVIVSGPDGTDVRMSVSAAPVRFGRGGGAGADLAVAVLRDVSELKRFEAAREEFMSTAAHELKTPLAVVKAHAQLMLRRRKVDERALDAIVRQIDRLNRIVQQLLEVSRLRVGGGELRRERVELGEIASGVADRMQPTAAGRILVERGAAVPVLADGDRIAQVMTNLVENALRFSPQGGEVELAVGLRNAEAVVSVRDHGVGIPSDRQDRIFERFYRAHAGTAEDYGGLGLGLDVSREIVAQHGGRIWFESEPGRGSTFFFSLPLAPEVEQP